jgi:hypothetical protein
LAAVAANGGEPYTYAWTVTSGTATISNAAIANPTVIVTADAVLSVTVTDACGNTVSASTATANVLENPLAITPSSITVCGSPGTDFTVSGGSNYAWTAPTNGLLNTTSGATVTANTEPIASAGPMVYTVSGTFGAGCTGTASATLNYTLPPYTATVTDDLNTAAGYDLALYTNLDGEVTTNSAWEQFSNDTWHQYSENASWGISVDHAIHPIMGAPAPVASFSINDNSICVGQTVTYSASGSGIRSYNWSFPGGTPSTSTAASQIVTYPTAGTFSATLSVIGACDGGSISQTNTNLLTVTNLPAVPTVTINGAQLVSSSATGNQWLRNGTVLSGATSQTYTPIQNGNYTVRVSSNGCFSLSSPVNVNFVGIDYLVTNNVQVFPNPANDELYIQPGFEKTESLIECTLLDLSGKMVFNKTFNNVLTTQTLNLSTSYLSVGFYQLVIQTKNERMTRKVAIAR